ncbi:MAG: hypothetical protein AAF721_07445 [Myxococcota bacterium]
MPERRCCMLGLLAILGCAPSGDRGHVADPQGDDPREYVGKDARVDFATLRFTDDGERARIERARECFARRGATWEHYPLRKIGNFIEEEWCRGEGAQGGCSGGNFRQRAGAAWAGIGTLHYDRDWPQVFGVQIDVGRRAPEGQWSVSVSGSSNGHKILGDHGHLTLTRSGQDATTLFVGTAYGWEIEQSRFEVLGSDDAWTLLDRIRQSPEALAAEAISSWSALETKVVAALAADEVVECVYAPYKGGGIPPECIEKIPLPPDKNAAELRRIHEHVAWMKATLNSEGEAMHRALLEVAPTDCL